MNYLTLDTEFTSFYSPERHKSGELLQIAIVPVSDGIPDKENAFVSYVRPLTNVWNNHAEKVHGITRKRAETFPHPAQVAEKLVEWLDKMDDLYTCMGYNCKGDKSYIERFVNDYRVSEKWYLKVNVNWNDVKKAVDKKKKFIPKKSFTLSSMCEYFNIPIDAHDALSDALGTFYVWESLKTIEDPTEGIQDHIYKNLTEVEKKRKYIDLKYVMFNGDGDIYITKEATKNPDALRIVLGEIWDKFMEK